MTRTTIDDLAWEMLERIAASPGWTLYRMFDGLPVKWAASAADRLELADLIDVGEHGQLTLTDKGKKTLAAGREASAPKKRTATRTQRV